MRSVKRDGTISDSDRDRMETEASIKAAEVRAMEFSLQVIDYELAQARAVLERPDATAAGNLVEVKSPVSGRVLNVMQESETVVAPGRPILEIGDPRHRDRSGNPVTRRRDHPPGDSVEIEQWGGGNPLKGRVRRVEPAAFTKISALGVEEQRVYRAQRSDRSAGGREGAWATATGSKSAWPSGIPTTCWSFPPERCSARATPGRPSSIRDGRARLTADRGRSFRRPLHRGAVRPQSRRQGAAASAGHGQGRHHGEGA